MLLGFANTIHAEPYPDPKKWDATIYGFNLEDDIDVASPMLTDSGSMRADIYVPDQFHLNQRGYDIWDNAISPVVLANEVAFEFPRKTVK